HRSRGAKRSSTGTMIRVAGIRASEGLSALSDHSSDVLQKTAAPSLERRIMKKLNKVASLFASAALAASATGAFAQAQTIDNWVNATGIPWKNGTNELCWRDANWTPATAHPDCDGAIKAPPPPPPAPPPAPVAAPAPAPVAPPPPPPVVVAPASETATSAADAFFDF